MKRLSIFLTSALVIVLASFTVAANAQLIHNQSEKTTYIASDKTIDDDLYITGNSVQIDGTVNGDVYAAAQNVTIRGTVTGDVFAAGQSVDIQGTVKGSVRAAGSSVRISRATIGGSVSLFGQVTNVDSDVSIGGGLNVIASTAAIEGAVGRGITGTASVLKVGGPVGKNVEVATDSLSLEPKAAIAGDLRYQSGVDVQKQPGAVVSGSTKRTEAEKASEKNNTGLKTVAAAWTFLSMLILGLLILRFAPTASTGTAGIVLARPIIGGVVGLTALIVAPVVSIMLLFTVIGIPLGLMLGAAYLAGLYLAQIPVALAVGELFYRGQPKRPNRYILLTLGLLILILISVLPIVGALVQFFAVMIGFGSFFLYAQMRQLHPQSAKK